MSLRSRIVVTGVVSLIRYLGYLGVIALLTGIALYLSAFACLSLSCSILYVFRTLD